MDMSILMNVIVQVKHNDSKIFIEMSGNVNVLL